MLQSSDFTIGSIIMRRMAAGQSGYRCPREYQNTYRQMPMPRIPRLTLRFAPDPFIAGLIAAVVLASILPCREWGAEVFGVITNIAIALLFFLHGAKLSRQAIFDGIGNWRLHLVVLASSFVMFP